MTNKEAKEKLYMEWQKFLEDNIDYAGISEAYKMAFKALDQEPCNDAISRDAALKPYNDLNDEDTISVWLVRENIKELPPVKPQTGHWIRITNGGAMKQMYICSECRRRIEDDGIEALITIKFPYCHCGAKMSENPTGSKPEISSYYGLKSYVRERSEDDNN